MKTSTCHFCGYEYSEEELLSKCDRCPMKMHHAGLGVSCCPNCGIEIKMKSTVMEIFSGLAARIRPGKH